MKHIQQNPNQCWLASMCMVHEELNYTQLSRSFPLDDQRTGLRGNEIRDLRTWAQTQPSFVDEYIRQWDKDTPSSVQVLTSAGKWTRERPALSGEGILHVVFEWHGLVPSSHAVAYSNGWIHDPKDSCAIRPSAFEHKLHDRSCPIIGWYQQPKITTQ